ncbi:MULTISPECIES: glycosyltransferase [Streptosporangium]|uniref:Glycosyltransferase involved in cell wall biosynthesis n=1 Tax=Streptosporangium brasiliense TaxID=47480 RepID=A0ABT9QWV6_9ACTN|nr:glycosyltransferase family 2 protein [Streptosporangium brasiliense]MDP9861449.1 glycosyltransferase involved in cell wall biosynthesis [Streptosporangium brasiliense]
MTATPLVSVIIPNYNYADVLGLCLRSVQEQTYSPIEIIYVDDCSTDDSVRVAESHGVRVLSTPRNSGVSAARNLGVAHARGEVLFFLDSDVALAPDAVAQAVALLGSDPGIGAVSGNYEAVPLRRDSLVKEYRTLYRHYWYLVAEGPIKGFLPVAIIAFPAAVWAEVGPWTAELTQSEGADIGERLNERYTVLLTSAVRGRHDDDATLRIALRKVFTRTRVHVPFFLQPRRAAGVVGSPESAASLAAALTLLALPVPLLTGAAWSAALPALLLAAWLGIDRKMYRYVFATRGAGFGLFFVGTHFLVNLTIAAGAGVGIVQWLTSRSFRRMYAKAPA